MESTASNGYPGNSASTKRCRREKTFAELKKEERSQLKERKHLIKELANVNAKFKAQRAKIETMKRMKLLLSTKFHDNPSSKFVELECTPIVTHATQDDTHSQASESRPSGEGFSLIPVLNMKPSDDASYTNDLFGMS